MPAAVPCDIVIATRDRRRELLRTLGRLRALPEAPRIVVVDNGSSDGTLEAVRRSFPQTVVVEAGANLGAAARNVGVERATSPIVAFSDDDSWWEPGALTVAARLFARYPRMGVLAARVLLADGREDPVCADLAASPLPDRVGLPGPPVLGFVACGAVVRREAFLEAGGFHPRFSLGSEEELLALDLATNGWGLAYVPSVVARHSPSPIRDRVDRRRINIRNSLWAAWLRRSSIDAARRTARIMGGGLVDRAGRRGILEAVAGSRWVMRERSVVPADVREDLRLLDGWHAHPGCDGRRE